MWIINPSAYRPVGGKRNTSAGAASGWLGRRETLLGGSVTRYVMFNHAALQLLISCHCMEVSWISIFSQTSYTGLFCI